MPPPLLAWDNFYVIVGSSAAALTGLFFVVIALVADLDAPGSSRGISAFSTPNVVHFCATLMVSATLSAPWPSLSGPAIALIAYGVAGAIYTIRVMRRAHEQTDYKPVLEDWLFHVGFPLAAYLALLAAGITVSRSPVPALFACAGATMGLILIGIHNAWDIVTYLATQYGPARKKE
jgi:hypothetical protein